MASPSTATPSTSSKIGYGLAKILHIDLQEEENYKQQLTRGDSVYSLGPDAEDVYVEAEPTVMEYFQQFAPTWSGAGKYLLGFFPFITWIGRYNLKWGYGDLVAGLTVGCVVIPQGSQ